MDIAAIGGRLVLASVLVVAGVVKLLDPAGSREAAVALGVPRRLASRLNRALPIAEIAIAVALVPSFSARWAAMAALALLTLFTTAIIVNLARGRKPECHCFGQLYSAPIGTSTLVRNAALMIVAAFASWRAWNDPGPSIFAWLGRLSADQWIVVLMAGAILVLLALQGWFMLHLFRQHGRLLVRLEALEANLAGGGSVAQRSPPAAGAGLPVGSQAPEFALIGLDGEIVTLAALRAASKPVMLLFTAPGCGPCDTLMPELAQSQREHAQALSIAVVCSGPPDTVAAVSAEYGLETVLHDETAQVAQSYRYAGTPSAVVVSVEGRVATPVVAGPDAIRSLMADTLSRLRPVPVNLGPRNGNGHAHLASTTPPIGAAAPALRLPDSEGTTHELAEFFETETVLLFWDPACGFCEQMLPDLKAWEDRHPAEAPELLVVSSGSVDASRTMGLRSLILYDENAEAMRAFGANGTPMAVLVDGAGNVASPVVGGAHAVLALAQGTYAQEAVSGGGVAT